MLQKDRIPAQCLKAAVDRARVRGKRICRRRVQEVAPMLALQGRHRRCAADPTRWSVNFVRVAGILAHSTRTRLQSSRSSGGAVVIAAQSRRRASTSGAPIPWIRSRTRTTSSVSLCATFFGRHARLIRRPQSEGTGVRHLPCPRTIVRPRHTPWRNSIRSGSMPPSPTAR